MCCDGCGFYGKVLLNLKTNLEELVQRGHEVTVLKFPSIIMDQHKHSALHFENIPVSQEKDIAENYLNELVNVALNIIPNLSLWQGAKTLQDFFIQLTAVFESLCRSTLYNQTFMNKLRDAKYDLMVIDPVIPCGELVAEVLQVPFVNTLRFSMGSIPEKYCGHLPIPLSYVPVVMSELSDQMTFPERVKNVMLSLFFEFGLQQYDFAFWDQFYSETLGRPNTFCETIGKAEIWLIWTYWVFEFPRPYLPNFEFVGGLHCKPAKPLPKSSGEHGVVVFSLGSMVKNLTEDKANLIASALAQIPQKDSIQFHHSSGIFSVSEERVNSMEEMSHGILKPKPSSRMVERMGYEAIYHGIPMVGVPIFADQPDNIAHTKAKGAALKVNFNTMTSADLLSALRAVINEPSYKENAMRLLRIHHEQPVKPLDRAVLWIELLCATKGPSTFVWQPTTSAGPVSLAGCDWVLLVCVVTLAFIITKCCLFTCRNYGSSEKKKQRNRKKKN
ncbi:hypothetical protein U0070_018399 [Myodes glareolus]|uniref:UDP-glucuronosyltransferase n=1 Tax=Myodes glareolus TaxID=447135 RepID=A0AAW0JVE1_MYOGA